MHNPTYRVISILNTIAANDNQLSLSDIARLTSIPVGTICPILQTLVSCRFLSIDSSSSTYKIGLQLYLDGYSFMESPSSLAPIKSVLESLTEETGETSHFAKLDGGNVLYLQKIDSPEPIRMFSAVGKQLPAYGAGLGKALMSELDLPEIKALYPDGLIALTKNTITDFDELYNQIVDIKKTGFSYECEESNYGVRCIAVPLKKNNHVVAAVSVGIPVFRYNEEKKTKIEAALTKVKSQIEKLIVNLDYV